MLGILELFAVSLVLLLLTVGLLRMRASAGSRPFSAPPAHRHPVARIVCAVVALGIVLALAVMTSREAANAYRVPEANEAVTVTVAKRPLVPEDLETDADGEIVEPERMQMRVNLLLLEPGDDSFVPLAKESLAFDWPRDRRRQKAVVIDHEGYRYTLALRVDGFERFRNRLHLLGNLRFSCEGTWGGSSRSSGIPDLDEPEMMTVMPRHHRRREHKGFSLYRSRRPLRVAVVYVTAAPTEEGFVTVPMREWLCHHAGTVAEDLDAENARMSYVSPEPDVPAAGFIDHFGPSTFLLLLAAICLAQLFRRRVLAFAGTALAMVVFAIALEGHVFRVHSDRFKNGTGHEKQVAAEEIGRTFFFRKEAALLKDAPRIDDKT
jgi:hypothetical protein